MKIKGHLVVALIAAVAAGVIIVIFLRGRHETPRDPGTPVRITRTEAKTGEKEVTHLYFSDKSHHYLTAEQRTVVKPADAVEFGRNIIMALIEGPRDALMRTLPEETELRAFYVDEQRCAYVDLSETIRDKHSGGAESELLTVYSIVNSLVLNVDEIETVKLLIEGRETITLAGHINTQQPFSANMLLIR